MKNKQKTRQKKQECRNMIFQKGKKISPKKTHEKTKKNKKTKKKKKRNKQKKEYAK